jgi:Domain of unknown function (DUF4062)/NACHT domain
MAVRTVFLSSTGRDLSAHRASAYSAVEGLDGFHCVRMEDFGARDWAADEFCRAKVAECDLFVGIVGHVYGSIPEDSDRSYTEREYEAAVATSKPRLIFVAPDDFPLPANLVESDKRRARQQAFRARVQGERVRATFASAEQLATQVVQAIRNWEREQRAVEEPPGYVAPKTGRLGATQLSRRRTTEAAVPTAYADALRRRIQLATLVTPPRSDVMVAPEVETVYVPVQIEVVTFGRDREAMGRGSAKGGRPIKTRPRAEAGGSEDLAGAGVLRTDFRAAWDGWRPAEDGPLVVTGGPGAGKTTLLKHLGLTALDAATGSVRRQESDVAIPPGTLPVFIRLATLDELRPGVAEILASVPPQVDLGLGQGFFQDALNNRRCLLLLDGLDEAAETQRTAEISRWVERIDQSFRGNRIVLSSRHAAYRAGAVLQVPHRQVSLVALGDDEIRHFLARWYAMIEGAAGRAEHAAGLAASLADLLLGGERPELRELASTPLMLLVMALIHRVGGASGGGLPKRRVELYSLCVDVLLEHWNKQTERPYIPATLGRAVLRPLAFWLHARGRRYSARLADLVPILEPILERTPDLPERNPATFLRSVRDRSGLFGGQSEEEYAFVHPTFQEFLAAEHVATEPDTGMPARARGRR